MSALCLLCLMLGLAWFARTLPAATLDAGTLLEVRLRQALASNSSKAGTEVFADLIAPVRKDADTLLPQGAILRGRLEEVNSVGWGVRRMRASLRVEFDTVALPDGTTLPAKTRVFAVDNAREKVDKTGKIVGIRATSPFGHRVAGIARNIFMWDPFLQMLLAGSTAAMLRFPDAEIYYPAGAEMTLVLTEPLDVDDIWSSPLPRIATSPADRATLASLVRNMTSRTITARSRRPADFVNIVILGEPEWLERAFAAAGWVEADRLNVKTGWMCFRAFAQASPYEKAPMSPMLLDERRARYQYSKVLNNYSMRHHLRIYDQAERWNMRPVMAAASTHDLALGFSFSNRRFTHFVDRNIDNERAKIVNDLVFTGCVDAAELIERPWLPDSARSSTGEVLRTDNAAAVLELNPCRHPLQMADPSESQRPGAKRCQRVVRQFLQTLTNDYTFNNPGVQAAKGLQYVWNHIFRSPDRMLPSRSAEIRPPRATELPPETEAAIP